MRILQIFNRYSHVGGEEIAVEQISRELSMHHEFRAITFDSHEWVLKSGALSRFMQFALMAWNPSSIKRVKAELVEFKPDIVLLHNIMPVGSAGLYLFLVGCGVPVIQFIHNFRPFSVNGYCWGSGKLLPQGLHQNFLPEILAGAWQASRIKTAWYAFLIWSLHRLQVYQNVHGWIAISDFMKKTFVTGGIDESRISVISHSWEPQCSDPSLIRTSASSEVPVFLFLGRLTEEKGLRILLDAWHLFEQSSSIGYLQIAGDGPLAQEVAQRCKSMQRASFLGFQTGEDKQALLQNCSALIVPSVWWEPLGLVLYEAYDYAKPVIAARSGGIVDHVQDGVTGWLHEPGNVQMLADHLRQAMSDAEDCQARGLNGRRMLLEKSAAVWIKQFNDFACTIIEKSNSQMSTMTNQVADNVSQDSTITTAVYLADQNPGFDRSFGISRMTQMVMRALHDYCDVNILATTSKTSQRPELDNKEMIELPWGTRSKFMRFLTDHFHPLFGRCKKDIDVHFYPKGYLPFLSAMCRPSVVTIHDTIIQYDQDRYPKWRSRWEYAYWSLVLRHTLRKADRILTVSESSREQIRAFKARHKIPAREITVTYEPCAYENVAQPENPAKGDNVIHLASVEPHKRTAHLIRWWYEAELNGMNLPSLHLIGSIPPEVLPILSKSKKIVKRPFLEDHALQDAYKSAKALILPSEIEGFGLPALEAYYLGTPVCFVEGTSVEEVLGVTTHRGGFSLESIDSMISALEDVMSMTSDEVRTHGLKLRETYASEKVAARLMSIFQDLARK